MARSRIDWTMHGDEIQALYVSGLSVREIIDMMRCRYNVTYPSGTLTNFLGRRKVLRSKSEAHKLIHSKRTKTCEGCNESFLRANYNQRWCDTCTGFKKYKRRIRTHGMTAVQLEEMLASQKSMCAICDRYFEAGLTGDRRKTLYIDHNHATGKVRGLLCPRCNMGMHFIDNSTWHDRAIHYASSERV